MRCLRGIGVCLVLISSMAWIRGEKLAAFLDASQYPSIQEAVNALPDTGGTVFIPAGVYEIAQSIVVDQSNVTIRGAGSGTVLRNVNLYGGNTFELKGLSPKERIWRVEVSDMHLTGNDRSGHAVYALHVNEISLHDMWVDHHGKSGLYLDGCYENPRVFDNNITYNKENGIFLRGCHDIVVSANQLEENGYGIYAVDVWNVGVTGNSVDDHIQNSLYFKRALGSIISSNMFENSVGECLVLDEGTRGVTVSANVMRYSGPKLLHLIGAEGITVTGNTFDSDDGTCIEIEGGSFSVTISGNVLFGLRQGRNPPKGIMWGIVIRDSREISVTGNTLSRPFAGGIYTLGDRNDHLTITGNTLRQPSWQSPGRYSGISLHNTHESIVNSNIVIDDPDKPKMTFAIEETGDSDSNLLTDNQVSKGVSGTIRVTGVNTKSHGNRVLDAVDR